MPYFIKSQLALFAFLYDSSNWTTCLAALSVVPATTWKCKMQELSSLLHRCWCPSLSAQICPSFFSTSLCFQKLPILYYSQFWSSKSCVWSVYPYNPSVRDYKNVHIFSLLLPNVLQLDPKSEIWDEDDKSEVNNKYIWCVWTISNMTLFKWGQQIREMMWWADQSQTCPTRKLSVVFTDS